MFKEDWKSKISKSHRSEAPLSPASLSVSVSNAAGAFYQSAGEQTGLKVIFMTR